MDEITQKFQALKSLSNQFQVCVDELEVLIKQSTTKRTVSSLEMEVKDNLERSNRSFSWPNLNVEEDVSMLYLPFASEDKLVGSTPVVPSDLPTGRRRASTVVDKHHELYEPIAISERKRAQSISPVSDHVSPETSSKGIAVASSAFSPASRINAQDRAASRLDALSVCSSGKSPANPIVFHSPLLMDLSNGPTTAQNTTLASDDLSTLSPLTEDWFSETSPRPVPSQPHFQVQLLDVIWTFNLLRAKKGVTVYYIDCLQRTKRVVQPREQIVLPNVTDSAKMIAIDGGFTDRSMCLTASSFVPTASKTALTFALTENNLVVVQDKTKLTHGANKHARHWKDFKSV